MFKKLIAGALASVVLVSSAGVAFATDYKIDTRLNPNSYYHVCDKGVANCKHYGETTYIGISAMGTWGIVYSPDINHKDTYKYISVTTYGYKQSTGYYAKKTIKNGKSAEYIYSPNATIDRSVGKVVFNGKIYNTDENSGILKKYLIAPIRSGLPIK